jgi:group I intron endonuclease
MSNINENKKYHFIYKTTCLINEMFYIGMHSTSNLKDGYLGSGKRLKRSIKKYGVENFKFEILEYCDTRDILIEREKEIVNKDLLNNKLCLNLMIGGRGGFISHEQQKNRSRLGGLASVKNRKLDTKLANDHKNRWISIVKKYHQSGVHDYATFKGRKHSDITKLKMSNVKKGKGIGESNSQFGSCWITDGFNSKKIKKTQPIPEGWRLGRN